MPNLNPEFAKIPQFKDLELGTKLQIVGVSFAETQNNHYKSFTMTLQDGSEVFGLEKAVLRELGRIEKPITKADPLNVTVGTYYSSKSSKQERTIE